MKNRSCFLSIYSYLNVKNYLQPALERYICRGPAWLAKPLVEFLARHTMLSGQLSRLYDELMKTLWFVQYVLATTEPIYG